MKKITLFLFSILVFHLACAPQTMAPQMHAEFDLQAVRMLAADLISLPFNEKVPAVESKTVEQEAWRIAQALVDQTRKTQKEFRMSRGPIWSNFLIKIGKREKGYCYHWVPELLRGLPQQPMQAFERHWGGSFLSLGRENNAVIITRRAAPLATGIVYDAWRGVGLPFWKKVSEDKKYRWEQRFNESQILLGEAQVEGK